MIFLWCLRPSQLVTDSGLVVISIAKGKVKNTCCEIVHGIKSPEALLPRAKLFIIEDFDISPSRQTFKKNQMPLLGNKKVYHAELPEQLRNGITLTFPLGRQS